MLLQRLNELAERLRDDPEADLPPPLYQSKWLRYVIELDAQGRLKSNEPTDLADPGDRHRKSGQRRHLPDIGRSGSKPPPILLADNAIYTLGIGPEDMDAAKIAVRHAAYLEELHACAERTGRPEIVAIETCLRAHKDELELGEFFTTAGNITFRVDGALPIDQDWFQRDWLTLNTPTDGPEMQCIVCGQKKRVLKRLKGKIKGVPGGQSSGTSIISANENAYESYGLDASLIAPICLQCSEQMTKGLNWLLKSEHHRITLGPGAFVFWTREASTFDFAAMMDRPDPDQVKALLSSAFAGKQAPVDSNRFYAAYLSGSGGRVVVREWLDMALPEAQGNLAGWFKRQQITRAWGEPHQPLGVYRLAEATVRDRKDLPAQTIHQLLVAALNDRPLPANLLYRTVERTRVENGVRHAQASLIKLVLCGTDPRLEDTMSELDCTIRRPDYLCGRLFAELEAAQRMANPTAKATITDRYYGTACTAPATVFGTLVQGAQAHLSKLKRDRPGAYGGIQARLEEIMSGLEAFPATLTLEEQAYFALGYYHQRAADRAAAMEHTNSQEKES